MKPQVSRVAIFIIISILGSTGIARAKKANSESGPYFFLAYGGLFKINPEKQDLSLLYRFHYAAPSVGLSPDGLYWTRSGEKTMAAFNP